MKYMKAKYAGALHIPNGKSILIPTGEGKLLDSKTFDFHIINAPVQDANILKHEDKMQVRFVPDRIKDISLSNYLPYFVYFESVTLHLLALVKANSLDGYFKLQTECRDQDLKDRLDTLRDTAKEKSISGVGKIYALSQVRNELAHNLYPIAIPYNNKVYMHNGKQLLKLIRDDSWTAMKALIELYSHYTQKMDKWMEPIIQKIPTYLDIKNSKGQVFFSIGDYSHMRGKDISTLAQRKEGEND